jgi:hypothetical protein
MSKKKYTFGGQKGENKPSKLKNGIWSPKTIWSYDIDREFYLEQEKIYFWGSKGENKPSEPKNGIWGLQSPKTEIGAQHQHSQVTYPSIENYT